MATDRELIEAAAKAAGLKIIDWWPDGDACTDGPPSWNPITSDADAFRLAVSLRIDLSLWIMREIVTAKTHIGAGRGIPLYGVEYKPPRNDHSEPYNGDPHAATRRAITRAAAHIGGLTDA